ncbi:MAG TPA: carbon starvation CstA family protein [Verrucomicrobiae bacterium]|nr:carbon starvation CstA family protein [Verrucomicrobiae bacterium]
MKKIFANVFWFLLAVAGAWAYATLALHRGETINSIYILIAALCSYAIGFRFYSKWIATRVLVLNDRRATPCEVKDDGRDYVRTNKWIVFGHHFAAISGPGPLVGPVLAAQFGYLPGTLWILIGVVLGGAVQDFVILFCSLRRNGKSLGQMVREEMNTVAGFLAMLAVLAILIILLAVLALVVVNALAESPWGIFTVGATIPIAMFMGGYLRFVRVGKVLEASVIGIALLLAAVWGGQFVHTHAHLSQALTFKPEPLAWAIILYGLAASVLPIWLLLAPRDYLSTFMKLGTIFALACGIFLVLPNLQMPALSRFVNGSGPVVPGKLFPFCFITIACGAISGFHTLISSGTTPKILTRESYARPIGYGAMCLESLVAIMALIAACTLQPGVYLSMNMKGAPAATVEKVNGWGFPVTTERMDELAAQSGEKTLFGRTGGAATLAVGMAQIFSKAVNGRWLDLWYHFAIMFEALFILTTLDAGTRVGRYLLQDVLGNAWKPLGDTKNMAANVTTSSLMVALWGFFLIQGVRDPEGGIKALWPVFGIANQMLAAIALCLATTVILKMQLVKTSRIGKPVFALVTLLPLLWLLAVTMTAGWQKVFYQETRPNFSKIGFLQIAQGLEKESVSLQAAIDAARNSGDGAALQTAENALRKNRIDHFNQMVDTVVVTFFLIMIAAIFVISVWEWMMLLLRKRAATLRESETVWLPEYAMAESRPVNVLGVVALSCALAKELSGEAHLERAQQLAMQCNCQAVEINLLGEKKSSCAKTAEQIYVEETKRRFDGVKRCC